MNQYCRPGTTYLFKNYSDYQENVYNALEEQLHRTTTQQGMVGEVIPYQLRSDWMVTTLIFICFILISYVLMRGSKYIENQFTSFFSQKERNGLFNVSTSSEVRYKIVLVIQTCMLSGFCIYDYFSDVNLYLFSIIPHYLLLILFIVEVALYVLIKWLAYTYVNWIFFYKIKRKIWIDSFFSVIVWCGFLLFPIVLLIIYFDLYPQISAYLLLIVIIIAKILLFYKCFSNFFNKFYGIFHLILYFCALEIVPDLLLWKGIILANKSLVLNF